MPKKIVSTRELSGRHVLFALLGFFAVVFSVNAFFLSVALSTHAGVVSDEPYRKGLKYNERIMSGERQALLGWQDEIVLSADGQQLDVIIRDAAGHPVRSLAVTATIGRPATMRQDVALVFEEAAAGHYTARARLIEPGAYVTSIEAGPTAGGTIYRARKRLWLKP